ncbi:TDP-N-acetylfucosamine:lipid II N-acetylfucosaminyltransferase [Colwellia piezophila]|uniref:TDP-N-acetylfucosamine:lipid II N-acetylfucosaminyltransferase n=1 Tax=Colwellia piezophila TaxID=211668 RepID=UPI00036F3789|nr:TDP-N-acetylfucosamine:lipid II N-acetylfucosaminyltransferase [Colwellia piezophila]
MKYRVVHIVSNEKFIKPFIELVNDKFNASEHLFLNISNANCNKYPLPERDNVIEFRLDLNTYKNFFSLWKEVNHYLKHADKVIVHGAFSGSFNKYLYFNPLILAKAYWVLWGGDLYQPLIRPAKTLKQKISNIFDWKVKGNFAGYITYIPGDYELAKKLYGAKGGYHECLMYPSNLHKEFKLPETPKHRLTFLVGNSADPSNNHEEIFDKLNTLEDQNFDIICPLSYGDEVHAEKIKQLGQTMFESRFTALVDFMEFDEYLKILARVDVGVFAHKRQQAMGNTITLLGLGKTVYMRNDVTPFTLFKELEINVLDIKYLDLNVLDNETINRNKENIQNYFSEQKIIKQLSELFK